MAAKSRMKFGDHVESTQIINVELIDGIKLSGKLPNESDDNEWPKTFNQMSKGDMYVEASAVHPSHYFMKCHDYRGMPCAVNLNTGDVVHPRLETPVLKVYALNLNNYE